MERRELITALDDALRPLDSVRAAWLGGSDASGRTDDLSDVDLVVVAEDDHVDDVFVAVESALERLSPIAHRYRLPSPTWHGHEQAFYRLERASPHHLLDLVVMRRSADDRFLERERHGEPLVLFDRDGVAVPVPLDRAKHRERLDARRETLRAQFPIFQSFVLKAIARGFPAEATHFYRAFTLAPLVEVMRMRHAPDRFDYGVRYLDRDLPAELRATVERLSLAGDLETLARHQAEAATLFRQYADVSAGDAVIDQVR